MPCCLVESYRLRSKALIYDGYAGTACECLTTDVGRSATGPHATHARTQEFAETEHASTSGGVDGWRPPRRNLKKMKLEE